MAGRLSDLLWELTRVPISEQKKRFKPCKKKFLAIRYENGAVRFYGSYNKRCYREIEKCAECREYENVNVLVPAIDVGRYGMKEAVIRAEEWLNDEVRRLYRRYVVSRVDRVVSELMRCGEVRLL